MASSESLGPEDDGMWETGNEEEEYSEEGPVPFSCISILGLNGRGGEGSGRYGSLPNLKR